MMYNNLPLYHLSDYFIPLPQRKPIGTYFYRLASWNREIEKFIEKAAVQLSGCGIFLDEKIANPNNGQLNYFHEMMGSEFFMEEGWLLNCMKKWMPRLTVSVQEDLSKALFWVMTEHSQKTNNTSILYNAYVKMMCILYYRFESVLLRIGQEMVPKVLFEGTLNESSLRILLIAAKAGCDVILIEKQGDAAYQRLDPGSRYSAVYQAEGTGFPSGWSIKAVLEKLQKRGPVPELLPVSVPKPVVTNTWLTGNILEDSLRGQKDRGNPQDGYYNLFCGMWGAEEAAEYYNMLFAWKKKLESLGRIVSIIENGITLPDYGEISKIKRGSYTNKQQALEDLMRQFQMPLRTMQKYVYNAMVQILLEEEDEGGASLQKYVNRLVVLLCWLNKFVPRLIKEEPVKEFSTVVYYGKCKNENEILFLQLLSRLPIDVFILTPDLAEHTNINHPVFFEKKLPVSMTRDKFPERAEEVQFGTTAYHAERELDTMMYQDTGIYRTQQFQKAVSVVLKTTCDEVGILWDQEAVYRPNFQVLGDCVYVPVLFAKISGVEGELWEYWNKISKMLVEDVFFIKELPYITQAAQNPFMGKCTSFIQNGRILTDKIKKHSLYTYSFIRDEMQQFMFDKMQLLIDSGWIAGTKSQGTEFTILAVLLNLDKAVLRMLQKYDFTKKVPKLLLLHLTETVCTIEDSILAAYLCMAGFDVVVFTPTGYNSVERYYTSDILKEHQAGGYQYDLKVPDFDKIRRRRESLADKLLRRIK